MASGHHNNATSPDDFDDEDMYDDDDFDDPVFNGPAPAPAAITKLPATSGPDITIQAQWNNLLMPLFVPRDGKLIDLKHQIFELTGVTPDLQKVKVSSWPAQLGDDVLLSVIGITANTEIRIETRGGTPPSSLDVFIKEQVAQKPSSASYPAYPSTRNGGRTGSSSVSQGSGAGKLKHEELMAVMESLTPPKGWTAAFDAKYGSTHPRFFEGTFAEALRESQQRRRLIIVYLHFPHHESTFPFCCATLCAPALATFINENFIFWAGTADEDDDGMPAEPSPKSKQVIKALAITGYPVLAVVAQMRGFLSLLQIMQGILDPDELLTKCMAIQENTAPLLAESAPSGMSARDQEKADAARLLREEQEAAYEASLREDRLKNELKAAMESAAKAEAEAAAAAEKAKQETMERKAKEAQARLSEEPPVGVTATSVAFRLTDGSRLQRRFLRSDAASILFDFLDSAQPALAGSAYVLVSSHPKRTVKRDDAETLEAMGLTPQAMLHVKVE